MSSHLRNKLTNNVTKNVKRRVVFYIFYIFAPLYLKKDKENSIHR